jgi:hypothetical protein
MIFDGASGRKPQTEARRHVYRVLSDALEKAGGNNPVGYFEGFLIPQDADEFDLRRLKKAIQAVQREMLAASGRRKDGTSGHEVGHEVGDDD